MLLKYLFINGVVVLCVFCIEKDPGELTTDDVNRSDKTKFDHKGSRKRDETTRLFTGLSQ